MRGLMLLRGLSFRFGTQFSTEVGKPWSVVPQKKACQSHIDFIEYVKNNHNINLDLAIDTFSTSYDYVLKSYYDNYKPYYNFINKLDPGNPTAFNRALYNIVDKLSDYDFLIISRNDMIFKEKLSEVFYAPEDEIKYTFVLQYPIRKLTVRYPEISDQIPMAGNDFLYFPKKYFHLLEVFKKSKGDNHDFIMNILDIDKDAKVTPYINTYHDSDPAKDWNPLYKFVGRFEIPQDKMLSNPNLKYPDDF